MRKSEITAEFSANIQTVWEAVTNNHDWAWRSDLAKVLVSKDEKSFVEVTRQGFRTAFTITEKQPFKRYSFHMENERFSGEWSGSFEETPSGGTRIKFTEVLQVKNPLIEILSYLFMNLKKIQNTYVEDLKKKLKEA